MGWNWWKRMTRADQPRTSIMMSGFLLAAAAVAMLAGSCSHSSRSPMAPADPADSVMGDFSLVDVNPSSATAGDSISPRQFLGKISAWYFGHAT